MALKVDFQRENAFSVSVGSPGPILFNLAKDKMFNTFPAQTNYRCIDEPLSSAAST